MYVARLRYIQTIHESPEWRNPDTLVWRFMSIRDRFRTAWLRRAELSKLRSDPFYYYVVARTKYYDQVIADAVAAGVRQIVGIGCGSDTRAYRFEQLLRKEGVHVLECDQPEAIEVKRRMARSMPAFDHVEFLGIDLNDAEWPELQRWLEARSTSRTLVMMEGVSPYVDEVHFDHFLRLLSAKLAKGSQFAYDFKLRQVKDDFGREGRTQVPFRLASVRQEVEEYHRARGFRLDWMELSSELSTRLLPSSRDAGLPLFDEDGLLRLTVA
jgi:methyltransferase (TIGR00027 family)